MSRETTAVRLVEEAYAATSHDPAYFRPMDPRRVKRLAAIFESTSYNSTETLNRVVGAHCNSRDFRLQQRLA